MSRGPGGSVLKDPKDVVVALRLLVLAGLALLGVSEPPEHRVAFWSVVIAYATTNLALLALRPARFASPTTHFGLFLADAIVVSTLVVLRGAQVPQFILAYFSIVLFAAIAQGAGNAPLNALLVSLLYAAITLWGRPGRDLLAFSVLSQFAFFFVAALFMGQMAENVRRQAREREEVETANERLEAAVAEKTHDLRRSLEELEAARSRLQASDRLATLGMLSAGLVHEIRNPLAAIHAALEEAPSLLEEAGARGAPDAERAGALDALRSVVTDCAVASEQLTHLAASLGALSSSRPGAVRPVPVRRALEDAARLLKHRARGTTSLRVECDTERALLADPGRLQQVLVNLAGNGFDAMEARGGVLTLRAEEGTEGHVRLVVSDMGTGMPPGVRERVFDPFFTTKGPGKGTGLGLHLVREIVQAHGGTIGFETEPGVGTRFHVEWPASRDEAPAGEKDHGDAIEVGGAPRGRRGDHPQGAREDAAARAV